MYIPPDVEIASVGVDSGDKTGYVCFEFEPDGTISEAYTTNGSRQECINPGSAIGHPIIHVSPADVAMTDENQCLFSTIHLDENQPSPIPQLMEYGAYDEFSAEMGDQPC